MGGFVHLELNTGDAKAARKFYSKLFGWKYDDWKAPQGVYSMVQGQTAPGIGLQQAPMPGMPSSWMAYIEVEDVHRTVARAVKAGATVTVPYFEVPGYGAGAWLTDPTGAPVAIWQGFTPPPEETAKQPTQRKAGKRKASKSKKKSKKKAKKKSAGRKTAKKKASEKKPAKKKAAKKKASKKNSVGKKASKAKASAKKKPARRKKRT